MKMKYRFTLYSFCAAMACCFTFAAAPRAFCQSAPPAGKKAVYQEMISYCASWDAKESACLEDFSYEGAPDYAKEGVFELLGEKLAVNGERYQNLFRMTEGTDALYAALSDADREFLRAAGFDNNFVRKNVKIMAATARYLAASDKAGALVAMKCLLTALLFTMDRDESRAGAAVAVSTDNGALVDAMVSLSCRNTLFQAMINVVSSGGLTEKALVSICKTVDLIEKKRPPFAPVIKAARDETLAIIEDLASLDAARFKNPQSSSLFPPGAYNSMAAEIERSPFAKRFVRLYANDAARQVREMFAAIEQAVAAPYAEASAVLKEQEKKLTGRYYNNLLAQMCAPNFVRMHEQIVKNAIGLDFVKISACLRLHKLRTGAFPAGLDAAARGAGTVIPADRFSAKSYGYMLLPGGGFVVTSTGPDLAAAPVPENIKEALVRTAMTGPDDLILTETGSRIK